MLRYARYLLGVLAVSASLGAGAASATASVRPQIIGGFPIGTSSWFAGVFTTKQTCSGSVIAAQWVLTAGHCLAGAGNQSGFVAVDGVDYQIAKAYVDPALSGQSNDAGLIKISGSMPSPYLPLAGVSLPAAGYAIGIGVTTAGATTPSPTPRAAQMVLESSTLCTSMGIAAPISEDCALDSAEQSTVCHGDSGGPFVINGYEVAMTEASDCNPALPAVFTPVTQIYDWLVETA